MRIVDRLFEESKTAALVILAEDRLDRLLDDFEIIREEETYFSDKIRLLKNNDQFLVQEKSTRHELILRRLPSEQAAHEFIDQRLETYENMWNGCGCKVNYYQ